MPEVQESYAVGWMALSLINAGLAQGKNRSGLAWWLVSLLLGPLATLLIVVLPRAEPGGQEQVGSVPLIALGIVAIALAVLLLGLLALGRGAFS